MIKPAANCILEAYLKAGSLLTCDIFDTAVRRRLARPEDVLLAVALNLEARGALKAPATTVAQARQRAEEMARSDALAKGQEEPAIEDIWQQMLAWQLAHGDAQTLARMEFEADRALCVAIPAVRDALAQRQPHQRLVFVSDTIYPGLWLKELLEGCGYGGAYDVVSSFDLQASKHSGRIYPMVLQRYGLALAENHEGAPPALFRPVAHLGDNPHSDVAQARRHGVQPFQWPRHTRAPESLEIKLQPLALRVLHSHWRGADKLNTTPSVEAGGFHRLVTPLLLGWAHFCVREAARTSRTTLWLLARDTWLLRPFVEAVAAQLAPELRIRYLKVSRASLTANAEGAVRATRYLEQEGFLQDERPGIVDLGWRGSLPTRMAELHPNPTAVRAFYFGLWPEALSERINPSNTSGYLFSFHDQSPTVQLVRDSYLVLEALFSAPEASIGAYALAPDGTVSPVGVREAEDVGRYRAAFFASLRREVEDDVAFCLMSGLIGLPADMAEAASRSALHEWLHKPSHALASALNRLPYDGRCGADNLVRPMAWHTWVFQPGLATERVERSPWRAGLMRLSLPQWLPAGDWDTWRWRLKRLPWV